MIRPIPMIAALVLSVCVVEGLAYWWMHPKAAGLGDPMLVYRMRIEDPGLEIVDEGESPTSSMASPVRNSVFDIRHCSSIVLLPEVVAKSLPRLSATTGTAARIDRSDNVTIHVAFFEWDLADSDTNTVMEAFIHLPEECMGSIGMILIEKAPPRTYMVGKETLSFDHTIFRDPMGVTVHAFKCTWVSGANTLLGDGLRGGMEQWHQLHMKAALKRFRPAHARVAQGAVRGIPNPDLAWQAFEDAMLKDLTFAPGS